MDYKNLSVETWSLLDTLGDIISGYKGLSITRNGENESPLYIFKDEHGNCHFVIESKNLKIGDLEESGVNGLALNFKKYRLWNGAIMQVIDLQCNSDFFLEEFTEVLKEIARGILEDKERSIDVVNRVIRNWKVFWASPKTLFLLEEQIIGLICELKVFSDLCHINAVNALNSWKGPLAGRHDFIFTDWSFEIKATRKNKHSHTINGIDQLCPLDNKKMAFLSFLVSINTSERKAVNLQDIIENISTTLLGNRPDLILRFNELLALAGYNPIYANEYRKFGIEILEATFYNVDKFFPKLTVEELIKPLDYRVSTIRYDISLEGLTGKSVDTLNWGEYFY